MRIQVNTDSSIQGDESLEAHVVEVVTRVLGRFKNDVTRVEVHFTDVNSHKSGKGDKHCKLEARVEGISPTAVTHNADTVEEAIAGAVGKMQRALDSTLGRRNKVR